MRTRKVVNPRVVRKEFERILGSSEHRVKGIVAGILSEVQTDWASELHGVAPKVMQAVIENPLEVKKVFDFRSHNASCEARERNRRELHWSKNQAPKCQNARYI